MPSFSPSNDVPGLIAVIDNQNNSASGEGIRAKITIDSHSVQFGLDTVSYNGGSITGLSFNTKYYVYLDDPSYQGGAVTYSATTSFSQLTASASRFCVGTITTPSYSGVDPHARAITNH
ncbi:hypothetical protein P3339_08160 [Microbulbifer sp. MLAF003]|uniref:hypothetical protein n=1 Tax=Microbulbifer sp. MLAF003 TaxID=3032582 RepID=UPI0024ACE677|nr:hypothetical protein [Microbulbifer sp. MLAF003]WHI52722.1 hypothetical protein P3339_08160 [Microbulbifer sp. MLAF003]